MKELGVELAHVTWNDRIQQLQAFKEKHWYFHVPVNHELLGK